MLLAHFCVSKKLVVLIIQRVTACPDERLFMLISFIWSADYKDEQAAVVSDAIT